MKTEQVRTLLLDRDSKYALAIVFVFMTCATGAIVSSAYLRGKNFQDCTDRLNSEGITITIVDKVNPTIAVTTDSCDDFLSYMHSKQITVVFEVWEQGNYFWELSHYTFYAVPSNGTVTYRFYG